ncbi:hypothetical protein BBJ28_00024323 [Nothophytophthora sp. Chile5]|nr:hypothetical protein BBJ28_00024323 [Nothophytophthora sp. Chile5]
MGRCDRVTGLCACEAGFEGTACERLSCPSSCSGSGRCVSMRDAATLQDDRNFFVSTTYTLWDADKSVGCQCDPGFTGFDCSLRECPTGDDPLTTGQANEVQLLRCTCTSCTGSFALSFRGRVTSNLLGSSATPSDLKAALEALDNVYGVTVTVDSGTVLCSSSGSVTSITFTNNPGNLPLLKVFNGPLTGLTVTMSNSVDGTRENVYCSNHGTCDFSTGLCRCALGFASSNGAGVIGNLGDCGYQQSTAVCPSTSNGECDGKGACSVVPYTCVCNVPDYTGYDCMLHQCPMGAAWFDGASAPNTAHALTQCSNKGSCNTATGVCTCLPPFTGAACDMLRCPVGTVTAAGATCSGRGTCKTIQQLSFEATDSQGNPLGVTYGATPNTLAVWDATKVQGCDCMTNDYFGPFENAFGDFGAYDCSMRACPRGADPFETGKVNEKQTLTCTAGGGVFTLTFRGETTAVIPYNAGAAQVQTTLEALDSVKTALVSFGTGSAVCATTPVSK